MLTDIQKAYYKKAQNIENGMQYLTNIGQQKEQDWAIAAGMANGLAGGAAAVMTAADIQIKNMEIREQNKKNAEKFAPIIAPAYLRGFEESKKYSEAGRNMQAYIDKAEISLIGDISGEDAMKNLIFKNVEVDISKTGAFSVRMNISKKKNILIFDNVEAVVDGTISADLYQNNKKVGSALIVLPVYGIGKEAQVEGICISGAQQGIPYDVKFTPYNLWVMEA